MNSITNTILFVIVDENGLLSNGEVEKIKIYMEEHYGKELLCFLGRQAASKGLDDKILQEHFRISSISPELEVFEENVFASDEKMRAGFKHVLETIDASNPIPTVAVVISKSVPAQKFVSLFVKDGRAYPHWAFETGKIIKLKTTALVT